MIKLAYSPEDDNVRYMIQEGGKPIMGTVPNGDLFRQVYDLCKEMHALDERVDEVLKRGLKTS